MSDIGIMMPLEKSDTGKGAADEASFCNHDYEIKIPYVFQEDQESWKIFPGIAKLKLHNTSKFPSSLASSFL